MNWSGSPVRVSINKGMRSPPSKTWILDLYAECNIWKSRSLITFIGRFQEILRDLLNFLRGSRWNGLQLDGKVLLFVPWSATSNGDLTDRKRP